MKKRLLTVTGERFTTIQIDIVKLGDKQQRFYEIKLNNAYISSITSMPAQFSESLSIAADSVTFAVLSAEARRQSGCSGRSICIV